MTTIEKIFDLLKKNSIQQKDFANNLGLLPSILSDWKSGRLKPSYEIISKIADYFNVTTDYLLGKTDNPKPIESHEELLAMLNSSGKSIIMGKGGTGQDIIEISDDELEMIKSMLNITRKKDKK